jgi:hypothetical protein
VATCGKKKSNSQPPAGSPHELNNAIPQGWDPKADWSGNVFELKDL